MKSEISSIIESCTVLIGPTGEQIRGRNSTKRHQAGQTLLEVALLTPLLLALLMGTIEMGRFAYISILVGNAARAGAGYGAESLANSADTTGIQTAADNDFQNNGQSVSNLLVSSTVSCGCDSNGTYTSFGTTVAACNGNAGSTVGTCSSGHWVVTVMVTAKGTFNSLFHYPGIPTSITLSRTATMRVCNC
jgi:Flp pilus assembly protein TadG